MLTLSDLRYRFEVVRREERRTALAIGVSRAVMALVAFVLLYFLFDRFFAPPLVGRWAAMLLGCGGVAWLFYVGVFVEVRNVSADDRIAEELEARHPELLGRLLSLVQLARARDEGRLLASPVLMKALEEETLSCVASLNFTAIVSREMARASLLAAVFAVIVQAVCLALLPWHFVALGARLFDSTGEFPTRARIVEVSVPEYVACGAEVPVSVRVDRRGFVPKESGLLIFRDEADGTEMQVELIADPDAAGLFRGTLPRAVAALSVVARLGDARSVSFPVRVVPRPEIKGGTLRYRWPAYLKRDDVEVRPLGPVDVLQRGTLEVEIESTAPLADAVLVERYGECWPLTAADGSGLRWSLREPFLVRRQTSFHLRIRDREGLMNAQPAVEFPVVARADQTPEVTLQYPSRDMSITARARLGLRFDVRDDYGVRAVWLAYRLEREGRPIDRPQRVPLENLARDAGGALRPEQLIFWHLARQEWQVGDRVTFWLEADDFCPARDDSAARTEGDESAAKGPAVAKSSEIRLTIVSAEEKTLELQSRIGRLYEELTGLKVEQEDVRNRVRELLRRLGGSTGDPK